MRSSPGWTRHTKTGCGRSSRDRRLSRKAGFYLVCGAVLKPTVSGQSRMNVQLQQANGQRFQAYTHGPDTRLAPGVTIANAKLSSRNSGGVTFYVLDSYDVVTDTAEQAA